MGHRSNKYPDPYNDNNYKNNNYKENEMDNYKGNYKDSYMNNKIDMYHDYQSDCYDMCPEEQKHVHELLGSVKISERETDPHNHRFATVTGEAIPCGPNDHYHEVVFRTDFYENHFHEFRGRTGGAIMVGDRHVHFIESVTTVNDRHKHVFEAATMINDPIGKDCKEHKMC